MRKEETVILQDGDRDITFVIKQMPALKLERFINKAIILLAKAGGKTLTRVSTADIKKLISGTSGQKKLIEIIGGLDYEEVEPLYNELLECCYIIPDANNPTFKQQCTPQTIEGQIESPITLYKLRAAAARVNFSFFQGLTSPTIPRTSITFPKATKISRD